VDGKDVDAVEVQTQPGDPTQVNFDLRALASKQPQPESSPNRSSGLGSVYVNADDTADRLQLNTDGSFSLQEGGQSFTGNYSVVGSTLKLNIAQLQKDVDILVKGNELVVNGQEIWTQPTGITKGVESHGKALEPNRSEAATHSNLAIAFGKARNFPEMEAETLKAAQLDPSKAGQFYYNLGAYLVIAGQSEQASAAFRKATEADPKHADSYYQLGVYLIGKASFAADGKVTPVSGTVEAFQKYLELAPTGQFAEPAKAMLRSLNAK
jgi:tetratricopeptide (TPR) repeat protein